jgi:hypothetical protein
MSDVFSHDTLECPRYVAVIEHADERTLFCDDSTRELLATLSELASGEIRERPEAIIDLDTNTRHEATTSAVVARFSSASTGCRARAHTPSWRSHEPNR